MAKGGEASQLSARVMSTPEVVGARLHLILRMHDVKLVRCIVYRRLVRPQILVFDSEWCASLELQGRPAKALRQQNGRMAERFFLGSQSRDVIWVCKECKAGCSPAFICRSPTLFVHAAFSPLFPSSLLSPSSRGKRLPVPLPNALP